MSILFITDSLHSLNGMAVFSRFYLNHLKSQSKDVVITYEANNDIFFLDEKILDDNLVSSYFFKNIIVNGHYSKSDKIFRSGRNKTIREILSKSDVNKTIISHGWLKVPFTFSLYNILYNIKSYIKGISLNSLNSYDNILFISNKSDNYRHLDYNFCVSNKLNFSFFDFASIYINYYKKQEQLYEKFQSNYVLVISNFDHAKNLSSLFFINFIRLIKRKNQINFYLLTTKKNSFFQIILTYFLKKTNVKFVYDQASKYKLIANANYLFIPSYTEYMPIVFLEATALQKKVVSINKFISLTDYCNYHFIKNV